MGFSVNSVKVQEISEKDFSVHYGITFLAFGKLVGL